MIDIDIKKLNCPSKEIIEEHKRIAIEEFSNVNNRVDFFINSEEECGESISFESNLFEDIWTFSLVMGMCGKEYYNTNIGVAYGRGDGTINPSIVIINKVVKLKRLSEELTKCQNKLIGMSEDSSKYMKTFEKISKLKEEIDNLKKSMPNEICN